MPSLLRRLHRIPCALILTIAFASTASAAPEWPILLPAALTETTPQVDPDAGAEILLQETTLTSYTGTVAHFEIFVRIKVYNDRGVSANALIDIPFSRHYRIKEIAARTILPDGTILPLAAKDFFDREIIKAGSLRQNLKSFAPPGLRPGAIIEYRYEVKQSGDVYPLIIEFQNSQPTRHSIFRFNESDHRDYGMSPQYLNCDDLDTVLKKDFATYILKKIPAAKDEPFQPPLINRVPVLIFLSRYNHSRWAHETNEALLKDTEHQTKPTRLVTSTLASLVAPADTPEQKLRKIYDYARTKILNHSLETTRLTDSQWAHENKNATATLKAGHGTDDDINDVFAALARAAGFEITPVLCSDREFYFLGFDRAQNRIPRTPYVFTHRVIAVLDKEKKYRFFDPGSAYLPFEELAWKNSETTLFVARKGQPEFLFFYAPPPTASVRKRVAVLNLDKEGTLQGTVKIEYTGLWQTGAKFELDDAGQQARDLFVKNEIAPYIEHAEITDIRVTNADRPDLPLALSCDLRIPHYAELTGTRLFFQPLVFLKNSTPVFPEATRRHSIHFPYPCAEDDLLTILLPADYQIESGSSPGRTDFEKMGHYLGAIILQPKNRTLTLRRGFIRPVVNIPVKEYPQLKAMFDEVHTRDTHVLTLKRTESK
ncbi:hypothetical protein CMV30_03040 [Nibricoccus aquaticus]|uniref:DUF3857 domain-containing protein n=1 Tax=Nibricoccus aquaticus TaxID=2576891 RepID=A0A290QF93_9BACT|nr:DUF3857 and transglutaminase domain-containing protein [Nibricoccus aquaticus]ATC63021.1 hypothetical protein CMV30_03040 [Nibricoccus aquaticus]